MQDNIKNYLSQICNLNILNENDNETIINMYNNIISYNFDEVFDVDNIIFDLHSIDLISKINPHRENTIQVVPDTERPPEHVQNIDEFMAMDVNKLYRGNIKSDDTNSIFKTYIINDQHIWKDYYCVIFLVELYFKMIINDTFKLNNDCIIIPEIKKWGKVKLKNNVIMFFTETQIYEKKTIYDRIDKLHSENKYNEICSIIEGINHTRDTIYNTLIQKNIYNYDHNIQSHPHYNTIINTQSNNLTCMHDLIKFFDKSGVFISDEKYIYVCSSMVSRSNTAHCAETICLWPNNIMENDLKL